VAHVLQFYQLQAKYNWGLINMQHIAQQKWISKLSLCFIKHQVMKTYGAVDVYLNTFLTLALDGSEW
jgi:hypothetical protein